MSIPKASKISLWALVGTLYSSLYRDSRERRDPPKHTSGSCTVFGEVVAFLLDHLPDFREDDQENWMMSLPSINAALWTNSRP